MMSANLNIIKRDGSKAEFDKLKIENAILKAMKYGSGVLEEDIAKNIADEIEKIYLQGSPSPTVSKVEELVYKELIDHKQELTAKAYEGYRAVQSFKREVNTTDDSILGLLDKSNEDVLNENSNKNGQLASTQRDLMAGEVSKDIARRKLIPAHIVQAHDEGVLHYHDMDYAIQPIHNCMLINLEDMLNNGTVINNKLVESPKSFATACTVTTQIIAQIASGQYGGNSITIKHIAPFLRVSYNKYFDKYKEKYSLEMAHELAEDRMLEELKSGIQTIRYQLSTLHTSNGQSPFSTIYLEIEEGGEFEREEALICEEMIVQRLEGMKNYKGQEIGEEFPKLVYLLDEHNCLEGGKYDYITKLAAKCNTKRLVPDYQSAKIMRKNYDGETFPPMGCRSHLSNWKDENGNYKWYGRFNQGVVSLNLVQVALTANKDMDKFWEVLDERLSLCREALMVRHNLLLGTSSDISPIHWQHGGIARLEKGEKIDSLLKDGYSTLSLGYVGIYEMTQAMLGVSHTTKEGEEFALKVMNHLKGACDSWKAETGLGFGLYGTPGESLTSRFCRIDKQKFGEIRNVTDRMYYTNSYHVHVTEEIDAFEKLKFESQFHDISLGGCISYVEVPDMSKNLPAVEQIINYIYHNIQYAEINTKPDVCFKCGYTGEIKLDDDMEWYCPNCGNKDKNEMQVMRRTCGYIGSNMWGKGRTQEISQRVLHL
ncbi:anaerobic ribonucleoside-triphosphate reductase [Intestinibacter bartlettii]|uniref:Anaerobic ribonucleoside-triphosphate reductase n=2 Tax=Intestinibacter bartlettii TaxID=261299 RepID=A0ABS8D2F2_9FIRM|nr:anaerobic ribonucleoside-triphosphate reductase [Intestinibacter bartlettii]MCB5398510.1 anaerobic ribonucleoside-triphosphate reductase [Intestinibacter bartlettii]MCB5405106.1 anaerobic ribonucleoside-triphosphate reductase [Intestinibacter bartlettii]MCB5447337.1 anaerobic ribonucleoside-triphosphate reductase [Intestinibacter bartlettii]MCB5721775.1 anaerobic ribonucleoside-triphosphate reductase [Intestinibacter bartlettii]MCB5750126.1 anaerobic ribonucleoside-triphosphate reductase [I